MRRILAITLLIAFGSPFVLPLLAATPDLQSSLPACCRRNGAHHCAGTTAMAAESLNGAHLYASPDRCPMSPKAVAPVRSQHLTFNSPALLFAEVVSHPAMRRQTEARARVALDTSRQKRGPPAARLS
jgi:hypothetical protein